MIHSYIQLDVKTVFLQDVRSARISITKNLKKPLMPVDTVLDVKRDCHWIFLLMTDLIQTEYLHIVNRAQQKDLYHGQRKIEQILLRLEGLTI